MVPSHPGTSRLGMRTDGAPAVAVVGAGLGGLSAAISLSAAGCSVRVFEKNKRIGGKLNVMRREGFSFDMGPSILTLPQVFRDLFGRAGRDLDAYVRIRALPVHWRCFFDNAGPIDLVADRAEQRRMFAALGGAVPARFDRFLAYSRRQYELIEDPYFRRGVDSFWGMVTGIGLAGLPSVDGLRSMGAGVRRYFDEPRLRDIFSFFAKYIGSSADNAPGFLNLMPWIQYAYGLWYVDGGMYALAGGLGRLLGELGGEVHCNAEVVAIEHRSNDRVSGVRLADGTVVTADVVVSNMEVIPAHRRLLHAGPAVLRRFRRFEPACSGLVLHLGVDRIYEHLAHHNFLFSANQTEHFSSVFDKHRLPEDPTIYLVAPARTDPTVAPPGHDILKILPHIPSIDDRRPQSREDYARFKERVIDKCERMGLPGLRKHTVFEHWWTPYDIERLYYSNGGSIYGVVSDLRKNYALKAPKRSSDFDNLFFVGGSVNPGGGMPMVVLSGMQTADLVREGWRHG